MDNINHELPMGNNTNYSLLNMFSSPVRIDVIENADMITFVYKEHKLLNYTASNHQDTRVFKIVFSAINGKWNKSERIYGEIIPATPEQYIF